MGVYFEPRRGNGWLDFAGLAASQLLGGFIDNHFEGKRQQREFDYLQQAADAEIARKQEAQQWVVDALMAGRQPGNLDMRGDPNGAMYELARLKAYSPELEIGEMLKNLNAPMQYQTLDTGGAIKYGTLNPSTGDLDLLEAAKTIDPNIQLGSDTQRYVSDNSLAGTRYASDADVRSSGIRAGATRYAADRDVDVANINRDAKGQQKGPLSMEVLANLRRTNRTGYGEIIDPAREKQFDIWEQNLMSGQTQPVSASPENKALSPQPTEVIPGTNVSMSDPRVQEALNNGESIETIAAFLKKGSAR